VHFEFVSGDFHTTSWFFSKVWMFWMESDIFEYGNINFSCHSNIALWSAMFSHGALALCTLTRRRGSNFWALELQFCHPQIQGPPQYVSIRSSFWQAVAAAGLGWAALGLHLPTKIWHFGQAFAT